VNYCLNNAFLHKCYDMERKIRSAILKLGKLKLFIDQLAYIKMWNNLAFVNLAIILEC
jgi:hypothetical protein